MYLGKIKAWYPTVALVLVLLGVSLAVTYMITQSGTMVAPAIILGLFGMATVTAVLKDFRVGLYLLVILAGFMFYIERILRTGFPFGTIYDALAALTFAAVFVNGLGKRDWTGFKNPVTILFIIVTVYQVLQVVNPAATSRVAWLVAMRNNSSILLYIAFFQMFVTLNDIRRFTTFWLAFAFIVGFYGVYQEYFGLFQFETDWIVTNEERLKLYFIWGRMRKFSVLSDPSAYGLFASMGGLAFLVMSLGPFKTALRIFFALSGIMMLVAMSYSGTRTATAMTAVGIVFYVALTLRNRTTVVAAVVGGFIGALLFFGPFYGGTMSRIRSTFSPSEDPSMQVRDQKRIRLQKYVQSHPIGGGLYTTGQNGLRYSRGHQLAEGWDPDSGYLLLGLELGWIGLILFMVFFFMVMVTGIRNYFSINDPLLKTYLVAYLVPFFALSVAHYTQDAIFTKPMNLIAIAAYAVIVRIPQFDNRKLYSVDLV
jgi:putative inorganic carbon (hco3(-)) transporter